MGSEVQKLAHLWDGSQPFWALLSLGNNDNYVIVNLDSKMATIIEDDSLAEQVIAQMLLSGVKVVTPDQW
jgi:hypothetical protein